jgi:hypothetical protein
MKFKELKDGIIGVLYKERSRVLRSARMKKGAPADTEYMALLEHHIDKWEALEESQPEAVIWKRLDAICSSIEKLQMEIDANAKKR